MGPQHYFSWGFFAICGVTSEIIRKPDPMSDKLTYDAFTADVLQQLKNNCPSTINPMGTILLLFIVCEAMDSVLHQGITDIERTARLTVAETVIVTLRKYVEDAVKGRVGDFAMHGTPKANFVKFCNSFLGQALEWASDYADQPYYPPGHGSIRLETRFGIRRAKDENFGLLELANQQLNDLAVAALVARGAVCAPSNSRGYVSHEEREMHPSAYKFTPKPVLQTVMVAADQLSRRLLSRKLMIDVSGAVLKPLAGSVNATPLVQVERDEQKKALEEADSAVEELEVAAADSRLTSDVAQAITGELSDDVANATNPAAAPADSLEMCEAELEESSPVANTAVNAQRTQELEDETLQHVSAAAGLEVATGGTGGRTGKATEVQCEQLQSTWLAAFDKAIELDDFDAFCQALIDIRKATMAQVGSTGGMRVRTLEQQQGASAAQEGARNKFTLQDEQGNSVHPATMLRKLRSEKAGKYFTFRKNTRLMRWTSATEVAAGAPIALDEATVQAGEVWLVLDGPTSIKPVVVVAPCIRVANGLRPENNRLKPNLLKDCQTLGLDVFGTELTTTASGTTFQSSGKDFSREPRILLHKVPSEDFDGSGVRTAQTLLLSPAAMAKLKALATDKKMAALWKVISPGKKKAASSSSSSAAPPIDDAMRAAVAAAAARAVQKAAAVMGK